MSLSLKSKNYVKNASIILSYRHFIYKSVSILDAHYFLSIAGFQIAQHKVKPQRIAPPGPGYHNILRHVPHRPVNSHRCFTP